MVFAIMITILVLFMLIASFFWGVLMPLNIPTSFSGRSMCSREGELRSAQMCTVTRLRGVDHMLKNCGGVFRQHKASCSIPAFATTRRLPSMQSTRYT